MSNPDLTDPCSSRTRDRSVVRQWIFPHGQIRPARTLDTTS